MNRIATRIAKGMVSAIAVAGMVLVAPTAASAAEAGTDMTVCLSSGGFQRGCAEFFAYGEHLYACDKFADSLRVTAIMYWDGQQRASVSDPDGASGDCGHLNLSIGEGKDVGLSVCVESVGCTPWIWGKA